MSGPPIPDTKFPAENWRKSRKTASTWMLPNRRPWLRSSVLNPKDAYPRRAFAAMRGADDFSQTMGDMP